MTYTISLPCGCDALVVRSPHSGLAQTRVIDRRDPACAARAHQVGARVYLWDLLPKQRHAGGVTSIQTFD